MSSQNKDPLDKEDTPSQFSESHSESDVEKAEEDLKHLKIEEHLAKEGAKDQSDESKPIDSPNQEGTLTCDSALLNESTAGPSGLQDPRLASSDGSPDPKKLVLSDPQEVKEAKGVGKNVEAKMMEGDSDTTSSTPPSIQSSTGVTPIKPPPIQERKMPVAGPSGWRREVDYANVHRQELIRLLYERSSSKSRSSRFGEFASSSANTSSDVSEIRSELTDISTEGSVFADPHENFQKEQSPSTYVSAVERQSSEASESNSSEIQDEVVPPPTPPNSSKSTSTPSGEEGHRAYLAQLQREAEERGTPISASSRIGSTNQSELVNLQRWDLVREMGSYRRNVNDAIDSPENVARSEELQATSESVEVEPLLGQRVQDFDRLFQQMRNEESEEVSNIPEDAVNAPVKEKMTVSCVGTVSPSVQRKPSMPLRGVSTL